MCWIWVDMYIMSDCAECHHFVVGFLHIIWKSCLNNKFTLVGIATQGEFLEPSQYIFMFHGVRATPYQNLFMLLDATSRWHETGIYIFLLFLLSSWNLRMIYLINFLCLAYTHGFMYHVSFWWFTAPQSITKLEAKCSAWVGNKVNPISALFSADRVK